MTGRYTNPRPLTDLWDGNEIGDPFLMRFNGQYYLYCSSHGRGPGIKCWTSRDMMDFTYAGYVCEDSRIHGAYAPEVCYAAGKFYMVTSPRGSGHYLLRADGPLGPFEVISENYGLGIDGSLFVDDDGKEYFFRASAQGIRVHDMPSPEVIDVHSRVIGASFLGHWTEGPMVIRRDGRYFLTDTGNHVLSKGYHVDYFVSHEGPDRGYRAMKDQQLLLETRDEYHALGHSSTCTGPDMDTMYIIYHKNILDEWNRPDHRSMCIDKLYFNGDRMYTNACWWDQQAPKLPVCACYDGEGLITEKGIRWMPSETGDTYTAELCGTLESEAGEAVFSRRETDGAVLRIRRDGEWHCELNEQGGSRSFSGKLPAVCDAGALLCMKASMRDGLLILSVNGLEIMRAETLLGSGRLGLSAEFRPGFTGFSDAAQGSTDAQLPMNIPGTFDACHAAGTAETAEGETNCRAAVCRPGRTLSFPVNVRKTGGYHVACTIRAMQAELSGRINGQAFSAGACGTMDEQGMERRYLGIFTLPAGESVLKMETDCEAVMDRITVQEADPFAPAELIREGRDITEGKLQIIGHKARRSMEKKFSGFTCAEGYGEGYYGGMWRDFRVAAEIHMDPCSPDASASIYLRSSRESWHPHQVRAGRRAYCVRILPDRIELSKQCYDEQVLAAAAVRMRFPSVLRLICQVRGNTVTVRRETKQGSELLLSYTDPMAPVCGRAGLDAAGDGIGFLNLSIKD